MNKNYTIIFVLLIGATTGVKASQYERQQRLDAVEELGSRDFTHPMRKDVSWPDQKVARFSLPVEITFVNNYGKGVTFEEGRIDKRPEDTPWVIEPGISQETVDLGYVTQVDGYKIRRAGKQGEIKLTPWRMEAAMAKKPGKPRMRIVINTDGSVFTEAL